MRDELIRAEAYLQNDVFASAVLFAGSEGILPGHLSGEALPLVRRVAQNEDMALPSPVA